MGGSNILIDIATDAIYLIICGYNFLPAANLESATVAIAPES